MTKALLTLKLPDGQIIKTECLEWIDNTSFKVFDIITEKSYTFTGVNKDEVIESYQKSMMESLDNDPNIKTEKWEFKVSEELLD